MQLKKSLGQYLLLDQAIADRIVQAVQLESSQIVLEIGPGTGVLTERLANLAQLVLAVEKDYRMVGRLRAEFKNQKSKIKIIHQDILRFDEGAIDGPYKLVGNLPYNITSPVIKKFLTSAHPPTIMVVMVQLEVAKRLTAPPGQRDRGILTVMVDYYGKAEFLFVVPRSFFVPVPKVDSAVVRIHPRGVPQAQHHLGGVFFRVVKAGFSAKRRQIHNSLAGGLALAAKDIHDMLQQARIDETKRAEDLTIEDWQRLAKVYRERVASGR